MVWFAACLWSAVAWYRFLFFVLDSVCPPWLASPKNPKKKRYQATALQRIFHSLGANQAYLAKTTFHGRIGNPSNVLVLQQLD